MKVICDRGWYDIANNAWGGAKTTISNISAYGKEDEFVDLCEELFCEPIDETEFNDFMWFDEDYIYECLDIDPYNEREERDEESA